MRRIVVFFVLIGFTSCNYFNVKKTSSEAILEEELRTFNWNEVDAYPNFATCNSLADESSRKQCFERTLVTSIYKNLSAENIIVSQDVYDTILIYFQISETGKISLIDAQIDSITRIEIPNIEDLLDQSLDSLPKIYPAIKRGQQVKTQFKLPILIEVN